MIYIKYMISMIYNRYIYIYIYLCDVPYKHINSKTTSINSWPWGCSWGFGTPGAVAFGGSNALWQV